MTTIYAVARIWDDGDRRPLRSEPETGWWLSKDFAVEYATEHNKPLLEQMEKRNIARRIEAEKENSEYAALVAANLRPARELCEPWVETLLRLNDGQYVVVEDTLLDFPEGATP